MVRKIERNRVENQYVLLYVDDMLIVSNYMDSIIRLNQTRKD